MEKIKECMINGKRYFEFNEAQLGGKLFQGYRSADPTDIDPVYLDAETGLQVTDEGTVNSLIETEDMKLEMSIYEGFVNPKDGNIADGLSEIAVSGMPVPVIRQYLHKIDTMTKNIINNFKTVSAEGKRIMLENLDNKLKDGNKYLDMLEKGE
uniref:Uncharacterized protein n=1 Tax=uncultured bacterium contig00032 TaxID=1181521 RepID=A0A806JY13_9BACT|nr:hypothetical protein [uncultured bacterium contig00032]